jgi:hypothetical protein
VIFLGIGGKNIRENSDNSRLVVVLQEKIPERLAGQRKFCRKAGAEKADGFGNSSRTLADCSSLVRDM